MHAEMLVPEGFLECIFQVQLKNPSSSLFGLDSAFLGTWGFSRSFKDQFKRKQTVRKRAKRTQEATKTQVKACKNTLQGVTCYDMLSLDS